MRTRNKLMTLLLAAVCGVSIMTVPVKAETENADSEFVTASEYAANNGAEENVRNFVKRLYRVILNREAEENGLNAWTKQLMDRKASGAQIVCGFVESDEFTQRGLTNEEVVEIMYLAMLDRASDDVGREGWTKILDGGCSYVYIVNGFAGSAEFNGICNTYGIDAGIVDTDRKRDRNPQLTQFVSRCYTQALGRQYEVNGLENWCDAIISGRNTPKQAAQMFIFSDEFLQKDLSSEEYVKVLYRTFMGREADEAGLNGWIEVLESGREDRMKVLEGFSDSVEFAGILESFGLSAGANNDNHGSYYSDYIRALMECKYYGKLESYMAEVAGATKEEAQKCYDSTVEYYAYQLMAYTDVGYDYLADETIGKWVELAKKIMAKSSFKVNKGTLVGDDFQVKVDIQPINIKDLIHDEVSAYMDEYNAMIDAKDTSAYTDEQWNALEEQYAAAVLAIIESHISEIGYKDTVSKIVIIEFDEEGRYGISENDWYDIDDYIVDMK